MGLKELGGFAQTWVVMQLRIFYPHIIFILILSMAMILVHLVSGESLCQTGSWPSFYLFSIDPKAVLAK
ncbi:hypothetical protein CWE17_06845 [Synechococcus sp. BS56D]|nr:hypothetical protein CWE17_06845 [Synechococcus sp. BS56D]